jgi:hypothetical protein
MDTTLNPEKADPRHVLVARADKEFAHVYEQITRAEEQITRAEEQLVKLDHDAARPAVPRKRPSLGGQAVRGFTGLALTACICVAAIVWQSSYGDAAKQIIARWAPQFVPTSSLPLENPGLSAQPSLFTDQAAAAKTAPPAQSAPEDVAPTVAALSPELTQLLQSMARDLATVGQGIEQLKARQEQMARDNANAVEQLKASQEQMAGVIAKASEAKDSGTKASETKASQQNLRPKTSALPPRPTATPTRKPVLTPRSAPAAAQPQAGEPQLSSAPRPAVPVR